MKIRVLAWALKTSLIMEVQHYIHLHLSLEVIHYLSSFTLASFLLEVSFANPTIDFFWIALAFASALRSKFILKSRTFLPQLAQTLPRNF